MVTLIPEWNTMVAAYGSTNMLNYADGDQFPIPIAPPIMVIVLMCYFMFGNVFSSKAKLVIAPVTTNYTLLGWFLILL